MYKQPLEAIRLIANFLDLNASDEVVQRVAEHSGLEQMKQGGIGMNHIRKGNMRQLP
jgi:hypothetical protein